MKKIFAILMMIFLFLFLTCTVNNKTGLINIDNRTDLPIRNLKIGNTLIALYLAAGGTYEYWFYSAINGNLTCDSIQPIATQSSANFKLQPGYWVNIKGYYQDQREVLELSASGINNDLQTSDYIN